MGCSPQEALIVTEHVYCCKNEYRNSRSQTQILPLQEGGLSFTSKGQSRNGSHKAASQGKLNLESEGEALQPYQAYEKLLREWVPFLKGEINSCVDFLMLKDGGSQLLPQGSTMSIAGS